MQLRTLGRTGWQVSDISCGTYNSFDIDGGAAQILELMQANLDAGVNLFDSAPMYGHSEANIGAAVPALEKAGRGGFLIATKVLQTTLNGAREQIEKSLNKVGGRIDLLQIHNMAGWRTVLPYLVELKAQGRIRATGVTDYRDSAFAEIEAAMKTGDVDVVQLPYNIIERGVEARLLPLARELNIGVLIMTPICPLFGRGTLLDRLKGIDLAPYREYGVADLGGLCLKWLLSKNPDVILLPATSKSARVASNTAVSDTPLLPAEEVARLEKVVAI